MMSADWQVTPSPGTARITRRASLLLMTGIGLRAGAPAGPGDNARLSAPETQFRFFRVTALLWWTVQRSQPRMNLSGARSGSVSALDGREVGTTSLEAMNHES